MYAPEGGSKCRLYHISIPQLMYLLSNGRFCKTKEGWSNNFVLKLPEDYIIKGIVYDITINAYNILVESQEFDLIPCFEKFPEFSLEVISIPNKDINWREFL